VSTRETPPRPALVVLDIAGTTVYDGEGAVNRCLRAALDAAGVRVTPEAVNEVMGLPKPEALRLLLAPTYPDPAVRAGNVKRIHDDFVSRMLRYYREDPEVVPIPGAEETFAQLRTAGIPIALDTGFSRDIADTIIERLGWQAKIDASVTSDEVPRGRPHPDMILRLMERFAIGDAAGVAKVGDTPSDLQEGTSAGCGWVVGVTEGSHTREQLKPYPHTHLIPTVAELRDLLRI
jgi:phosphonatase-like hydrolase